MAHLTEVEAARRAGGVHQGMTRLQASMKRLEARPAFVKGIKT